jgi:hypothetical protein
MKTSAESMGWYNKINEIWKSIGVSPSVWSSTPADFKIASRAIRVLWKKEMGRKFPYKLKEVSGNRHTWYCSRYFVVNTSKGWAEIIHGLGHWMGYKKEFIRPHCAEHATLEYRLVKHVVDKNWVEISNQELAKPKQKTSVNVVAKNYRKLLSRQESLNKRKKQYLSNIKRVENSSKKVESKIRTYERKYNESKLKE